MLSIKTLVSFAIVLGVMNVGVANSLRTKRSLVLTECDKPGYKCDGCERSNFCLNIGGGQSVVDFEMCKTGESCLEADGMCSSKLNRACDRSIKEYKSICHQTGLFPHPYDCTKYFMCIIDDVVTKSLKAIDMECEDGYAYDSLTTLCNIKIEEGKCPWEIDGCSRSGERGSFPGNPYLFYICLGKGDIFLPNIFRCKPSEHYVGNNCQASAKLTLSPEGKCTATGKFDTEGNCNSFLECTVGEEPKSETCGSDKVFNPWRRECEPVVCNLLK